MITNTVNRPQTLLSFGNVSLVKYHAIGKRMSENISMLKSSNKFSVIQRIFNITQNKVNATQIKRCK